jgi:hypothetical protein
MLGSTNFFFSAFCSAFFLGECFCPFLGLAMRW